MTPALTLVLLTGALVLSGQGAAAPLPDAPTLWARIEASTKANAAIRESFTYLMEETEQDLDGKGHPKSTHTKTSEVTCVPGGTVERLVAEDGKPLSEKKAKAEEERLQAKLKALAEAKPAGEVPAKAKGEVTMTMADLIAVVELGQIERSTYQGRPILALAFRPRKGAKTSGLGQRFASKLEGVLLVDEATYQVVHAECHMVASCWVGGGFLGSVAPPTTFRFDQAQVLEGVYMPVKVEFTVHGRFTVMPVNMAITVQWHDFHRFVVEAAEGKAL